MPDRCLGNFRCYILLPVPLYGLDLLFMANNFGKYSNKNSNNQPISFLCQGLSTLGLC